jgi:UDP-glucose:(heptosyl)LPS alpha-1,3-glucosyltransferase
VKKPRIAIIAEKYGGIGGSERFAKEVTERLAATGRYEFHVFANRWEAGRSDITFHRVPSIKFPRFLRPWFFKVMAQRRIARGGFDLVHSHWPTFRADVFSVHTAPHAYWIKHVLKRRPNLFDRVMMWMDRRMIEGGARSTFMPVSTFLQDRYMEVFGELPGEWKVVHPGVDAERFARDPVARAEIRSQLGIQDDEFVILFVGMNFGPKGLGRLMEGFAEFRRRETSVRARLVAIGRGPVAEFSAKASKLGIERDVIFVSPQATGIERYYSAADAFALLSEFETFGMVVLEAMAAGLPVIVSDRMGVKDLVREPGRVVAVNAVSKALDDAFREILSARDACSAQHRSEVLNHLRDWRLCANDVAQSYEAHLRSQRTPEALK